MSQEVDPKFSARNAEVAAQYLTIALNAVNSRVDSKFKRQKIRIAKQEAGTPNTVNNNVIVADRNQLLDMLKANMKVIDEDKN
jgi:metal-dependent amidase/aminoacylase/carboxypeptidase family protein